MNLGMPWYDYDPLKVFADAVKQARGFIGYDQADPNNNNLSVAKDGNGWPLDDAMLVMFHGASRMNGTYRLYFTTQHSSVDARTVTVQYAWTTATASNQAYDAATNTVRYDVAVTGGNNQLKLIFANTGGGVRNVKFMRPVSLSGTVSYDTADTFTAPALDLCRKFSTLRFMQVGNALSDNMVVEWADRTPPTYCCQQSRGFGGGGSAGVAYEYMIDLCNKVDADLYVCVPFLASDEFIRSLAALIKERLEPERKVYTEYSNELWNSAAGYDMHRNHDSAMAEVARGGSPLNFDSTDNTWYWGWRRAGKRGLEISAIFRSVFGDAAMMSRVRPLLMTQIGNGQATLSQNVEMLLDYYNNPARVSEPHPPNYYFYGAGGTNYYTFESDATTLDAIWSSGTMDTATFINTHLLPDIKLCATFGLKRVSYEGGTEFTAVDQGLSDAAFFDDRFVRSIIDHHNAWSHWGGDLATYFTLTGWGADDLRCTFVNNVDSAVTPKIRAIDSLNAMAREPNLYGAVPPCTIDGDSAAARFTPLWDPPSACRASEWYSYVFRVEQAGTYGVTVDYTSPSAGEFLLYGDGTEIGTPAIAAGTSTTAKFTMELGPGLHGVIVRITSLASGRMSIDQVNISVESIASATAVPSRIASTGVPSLRAMGSALVVSPGSAGRYVVTTLDGRAVLRGTAASAGAVVATSRCGSGVYLVQTPGGSARAAFTR